MMNGEGEMDYANGFNYSGNWVENLRDGYGTMNYNNREIYIGFWV